jgi:hypothetical protein
MHLFTRMRLQTKFLPLKAPVTLGSLVGELAGLPGWVDGPGYRLSYLVMVVRVSQSFTQ